MAELLAGVVQQAAERVLASQAAGSSSSSSGGDGSGSDSDSNRLEPARGAELPPPMIPGNADVPTTLCAMQASVGWVVRA